jgi:hypothetical protein
VWSAQVNVGSDRSLQLPADLLADLGTFNLFTVTSSTPRGRYEYSSRVLDPITGKQFSQDYNTFKVQ